MSLEYKGGAALIAIERLRQQTQEGWTPAHDDAHKSGTMTYAAIAYATAAVHQLQVGKRADLAFVRDMYWPWDRRWWKPSDLKRNLVKAGALIAAEIDRVERAEKLADAVAADFERGK